MRRGGRKASMRRRERLSSKKTVSWSWGEGGGPRSAWWVNLEDQVIMEVASSLAYHSAVTKMGFSHWLLELLPVDSTIKTQEHFVLFLPSICLIGVTSIHTTKLWVSSLLPSNYLLWIHLTRLKDMHTTKSRDKERAWILGRVMIEKLYILRGYESAELNKYKMLELRWWLRYSIIYYYAHLLWLKLNLVMTFLIYLQSGFL